ncbi:MAG: ligase-associated DNA damage response endonuclease PdeM [Bacteroidota bacterium]
MNSTEIEIRGEKLLLLPQRALFWPKSKSLIVSDIHLGKAGHFRKHGIPISRKIHLTDLAILEELILEYNPKEVILLGDLFHSSENTEWTDFLRFLKIYENINFVLVEGNHDILDEYPSSLKVISILEREPFSFTHIKEGHRLFNISGHIHPGVRIRGKARQGMTMPCFWFTEEHAIIPAFGQFTGIKKIKPSNGDKVFAVADQKVIELIL